MNRISPYLQLAVVAPMPGGFCCYLADPSFKDWAHRATEALLCDGQDSQQSCNRRVEAFLESLCSEKQLTQ